MKQTIVTGRAIYDEIEGVNSLIRNLKCALEEIDTEGYARTILLNDLKEKQAKLNSLFHMHYIKN